MSQEGIGVALNRTEADVEWSERHSQRRVSGCSDTDAEEIAQESMIRLSQQSESFQHPGTPGAFRGWLRTTVHNYIVDHHRDRIRPVGAG